MTTPYSKLIYNDTHIAGWHHVIDTSAWFLPVNTLEAFISSVVVGLGETTSVLYHRKPYFQRHRQLCISDYTTESHMISCGITRYSTVYHVISCGIS